MTMVIGSREVYTVIFRGCRLHPGWGGRSNTSLTSCFFIANPLTSLVATFKPEKEHNNNNNDNDNNNNNNHNNNHNNHNHNQQPTTNNDEGNPQKNPMRCLDPSPALNCGDDLSLIPGDAGSELTTGSCSECYKWAPTIVISRIMGP